MGNLSDQVLLQPSLVFSESQVNVFDAINLVAYARVPLVSARSGRDLVAGFVVREDGTSPSLLFSQHQLDALLGRYQADIARLRYPVGPLEYAPLLERMLDSDEPALPYFFHEHHELVYGRRRAVQVRHLFGHVSRLVQDRQLLLQMTTSELAGFPIRSEAWMTQKTLRTFLADQGVYPWWESRENLESHKRLPRILLSDSLELPDDDREPVDQGMLPSYLFATLLFQRSKHLRRFTTPTREKRSGQTDEQEHVSSAGARGRNGKSHSNVDREPHEPTGASPVGSPAGGSPAIQLPAASEPAVREPSAQGSKTVASRRAKTTQDDLDNNDADAPDISKKGKMLKKSGVAELLGLSTGTIDNRRKDDPEFPKPVGYGKNSLRWRTDDVLRWLAKQEEKSKD